MVSVGLAILTLFIYSIIANRLLRPLERKYDTFEIVVSETEDKPTIKFD